MSISDEGMGEHANGEICLGQVQPKRDSLHGGGIYAVDEGAPQFGLRCCSSSGSWHSPPASFRIYDQWTELIKETRFQKRAVSAVLGELSQPISPAA